MQTGAYMPMAVPLGSCLFRLGWTCPAKSVEFLLFCYCSEGIFCNLSHSLQTEREETILNLHLLGQMHSLETNCFEITWSHLAYLALSLIIVIFTYLQGKVARGLSTNTFSESIFHVTIETTVQTPSIFPRVTSGLGRETLVQCPCAGLSLSSGYTDKGIHETCLGAVCVS